MLEIDNLSKTYPKSVKALSGVSLSLSNGIFGLLGPNGAGKSTLMRTLATLQPPDTGSIRLGDLDLLHQPRLARRQIGYLPQEMGVYPRVTAREMLTYLAALKGLQARSLRQTIIEQLERVNLADVADQRLDTFSGGMRRRFGIAAAFLGSPRLVIVDEPTAGLDPVERRRFQHLLASEAKECVLILSSHIVEDIADMCRDMALLRRGEIMLTGQPPALVQQLDGQIWTRAVDFDSLESLQKRHRVLSWRPRHGELVLRVWSKQPPGDGFEPARPDLEDLYSFHVEASG